LAASLQRQLGQGKVVISFPPHHILDPDGHVC
jgi:hypothetical protein